MTHPGFIAAAYVLAIGTAVWLAVGVTLRTARVKKRLRAIDPRELRA